MRVRLPRAAAVTSDEPGSPPTRWFALGVLCVALVMVTLDVTVVNVALPTMVRELKASTTGLEWIVDSYVIVFAGLLVVAGSLADRIGRKKVFLAGMVVFGAGSAWAAYSGSVGMLIAARAGMGIGGAFMMTSTLALITNIFTDEAERRRAISLWAATTGVGAALGPIIGGLLLTHFWWGSIFLINVPVAVAGIAMAIPLIPESMNPNARPADPLGAGLSMAGLGLLLWSLIEAPEQGWGSLQVLAAGISGIVVLLAFVVWERRCSHPMLNIDFFKKREFSGAVTSQALAVFGFYGALFLLTQYLQFALGYSPLKAGLCILPGAGALALFAPLSAVMMRKIGVRYTAAAGLAIVAGGFWQISGATVASGYADIVFGLVVAGAGVGLVLPAATESVMGSLPSGETGVGAATNNTFMQVGGALGVAVIGSLLTTRYQDDMTAALSPYHVPAAIMAVIRGSLGGALEVAARVGGAFGAALVHVARQAFMSGMDLGMVTGALVVLCGAVVAFVVLPPRKRRDR